MGWFEWSAQLLLILLLLAALPFIIRLERGLAAVRRDRVALEASAAGLGDATRLAEAASIRLRASAEGAGRQVAEKLAAAEPMRDDLRYLVSPDPVPAGPQVWEVTNSGEQHAHHAVFFRIPDDVTADDIVADFASLMSGTPPAGPPLISQRQHVGYAALQSGGQTTWIELDLEPGTYAVICFIVDPATGMPHVLNGMAITFTVE